MRWRPHALAPASKKVLTKISQILLFFDFETDLDYFSTLRRVILQMFQLQIMIEKLRPDLLTLSTTFYDVSVSRNPVSKSKNSKICDILANAFFWIVRERVVWKRFQLQFMIGKLKPDLLTLSTTFYDFTVSLNLLAKGEMRQFANFFSKDKSNKNDQYPGNLFLETSIKLFVPKNGP